MRARLAIFAPGFFVPVLYTVLAAAMSRPDNIASLDDVLDVESMLLAAAESSSLSPARKEQADENPEPAATPAKPPKEPTGRTRAPRRTELLEMLREHELAGTELPKGWARRRASDMAQLLDSIGGEMSVPRRVSHEGPAVNAPKVVELPAMPAMPPPVDRPGVMPVPANSGEMMHMCLCFLSKGIEAASTEAQPYTGARIEGLTEQFVADTDKLVPILDGVAHEHAPVAQMMTPTNMLLAYLVTMSCAHLKVGSEKTGSSPPYSDVSKRGSASTPGGRLEGPSTM